MPTITKSFVTITLAMILAATGGHFGGYLGMVACAVSILIAVVTLFYTAIDAHSEGYQDGRESTEATHE